MKTIRILVLGIVGLIGLAACSDTPDSLEDAVSSLPQTEDLAALAEEIQTEMTVLATEIQNSEAADELQETWADTQSEMRAAIDSVTSDGTVDGEAIRSQLEEFQSELEAAGAAVSDDLISAWTSLRTRFEQLIG